VVQTLNIKDKIFVQSYKHNGSLHRTWSKAYVIDTKEDYAVVVNDHTWVVESDGRRWLTKEPAVCFYYYKKWFNVLSMVRKTGIYYYVNIASPSLYDGEAIKNIDYDLDVKVFPDDTYMVLDKNEYAYHANLMNYPDNLKEKIENALNEVIELIENKKDPFDFTTINNYLMNYFQMVHEDASNNSENTQL